MSKTVTILDEFKINYLTQAQYDAEVAGGTVQPDELYLTPSADYSTSEVNTGKKWIDGKPIYRKVVPFTTENASPGTNTVALSLTNRDLIVSSNVWVQTSSGTYYPFSFYVSANGNYTRYYISGSDNLTLYFQSDSLKKQSGYCVVEYTKTTD